MHTLKFIASGLLFLFFFSCKTTKAMNDEGDFLTGVIEQAGMTNYMYGSHTLTNDETFYALKSTEVDLNDFVGKKVKISFNKIEGYPINPGNPEYLEVLEIKEVK